MEQTAERSGRTDAREEFLAGIKAELPILLGGIPFGMIYGVLAISAGIPASAAQAMSAIVFAGSAQFVFTQLFAVSTSTVVIILTVAIINLRHALYSASVAPYLKSLSPVWKSLLAYLLTDEAYAVTITHYQSSQRGREGAGSEHWFFLGAGLALWAGWQASTAAGIFLGAVIPASWSLEFTLALTFIALVVPGLKDSPSLIAALSAGLVSVLAFSLPFKLDLMVAALVGIGAGLWSEWRLTNSG